MANDPQYNKENTVKNLKQLKAQRPKNSRIINEDGEILNFADAYEGVVGDRQIRIFNYING